MIYSIYVLILADTQDTDWKNVTQGFTGQLRDGAEKENSIEVIVPVWQSQLITRIAN